MPLWPGYQFYYGTHPRAREAIAATLEPKHFQRIPIPRDLRGMLRDGMRVTLPSGETLEVVEPLTYRWVGWQYFAPWLAFAIGVAAGLAMIL